MANHGTPLLLGNFAKLAGVVIANLPREMEDPQLVLDLAGNGDAVGVLLTEAFTRANLDRALIALGKKSKPNPTANLLSFVQGVSIPARTEKFVPKKHYTKDNPEVQFGWINPDFTDDFGDMIEDPTPETMLRQYVLTCQSRFDLARKEIIGEGFVTKTTPGEMYSMLEMQPKGPKSKAGPLLANGYANLFEMVNRKRVSRLVIAFWCDDRGGWYVDAYDASYSSQWRGGRQVFSRNSRLPLAA